MALTNKKDKLTEISFYRKNQNAYTLVILSIIAEFVYVLTVLEQMAVDYKMGVVTMANIGILFLLFTTAIKVNVYSKKFTMIGFTLAGYLAVRIGVILPLYIEPTGEIGLIYGASAVTLVFLLLGSIVSLNSINARNRLKEKV